eukprot:CAMPEP_0178380246 /NCGR_PEP_ID=MMETSP0689_2-20121128/5361_1 /TAXON_ID=160604 /ORGANISM="Amphidinium massartii, Strain CS-259" /LENGTH=346 /DNA_ID=CAMNT_0020000377 /DNA_START=76 /DNA_END=1112 /DNA_ORIENTATION=-
MGLGSEELVDPEGVSQTLKCAICYDVFLDPVFSPGKCQHVFCRACIEQALERRPKCPTCSGDMRRKNLQPNLVISNLLDELQSKCPERCGWTGRFDQREGHREACPVRLLREMKTQVQIKEVRVTERELKLQVGLEALEHREKKVSEQECDVTARKWELIRSEAALTEGWQQLDDQRQQLASEAKLAERLRHIIEQGSQQQEQIEKRAAILNQYKARLECDTRGADCASKNKLVAGLLAAELQELLSETRSYRQQLQDACPPRTDQILAPVVQFFVRQISGKRLVVSFSLMESVNALKLEVEQRTGMPLQHFYLYHGIQVLTDGTLLKDYGVSRDCTIHMAARLRS